MATEYYNNNLFTAYPFVESDELPFSWIVDVQVIMSPSSTYTLDNPVYLYSYSGNGTEMVFTFKTTNLSSEAIDFTITVPNTAADYQEFSNSNSYGSLVLTIGRVSDIDFNATENLSNDHNVYPTNIVNLYGKQLNKIHVANKYDTQYENSACGVTSLSVGDGYKVIASNLTGKINIDGGRNTNTSLLVAGNTLYVNASPDTGYGEEINCVPIRTLPDGYHYESEPSCADGLFFINGKSVQKDSNSFTIAGNRAVNISPGGSNTLNIVLNTGLITGVQYPELDCEEEEV